MIVIACVDDTHGMMFNHRRQSKDRVVLDNIMEFSKNNKLYLNEYSYQLFSQFNSDNVVVDCNFLTKAGTGDYCFVEDQSLLMHEQNIEKLIIYKWNRRYPADLYLDIALKETWKVIETTEFQGSSHEKITKEIYIK